jgi:hypothetical protein
MTTAVLDKLRAQRDEARDLAVAMAEGEDFDPANEDFAELQSRAESLDARVETLVAALEKRESARKLDARVIGAVESRSGGSGESETRPASFGEQFVRSEQFSEYPGRGHMARVDLGAGFLETRAPLLTSGFDLPATRRDVPWTPVRTPIQDAITIVPVTTNSVDVVTYALTNAAAAVAEGQAKPESGLAETVTNVGLDTIAHWLQMSRQLMEDSGAVSSRVDNALRRGVLLKLESEAAAAVAGGTYGSVVNADLLTAIRMAMGELEDTGYNPTDVYLNPADYAALDVAIADVRADGRSPDVQQTYWGLNVISSSAITAGTSLVADSRVAFEAYRRTGVSVYITDSHASTFVSNIFTLLGEARQTTVVVDPNAVRETAAA